MRFLSLCAVLFWWWEEEVVGAESFSSALGDLQSFAVMSNRLLFIAVNVTS